MKTLEKTIRYRASAIDQLPETDRRLAERAQAACDGAWAPYSGFRVGAAALLDNGAVVAGNNQESEVFPAGLCAERVVIFSVLSQYSGRKILKMAIAAWHDGAFTDTPVTSCGICVQSLVDLEKRQGEPIAILFTGNRQTIAVERAADLLPFTFSLA
ncbi:MAG: cytidine deaminase [Rikenellaceae bacterium]|jgi:cytidine deaminase|nr:cytidine deaminase [Rikenellaceae bacterium]